MNKGNDHTHSSASGASADGVSSASSASSSDHQPLTGPGGGRVFSSAIAATFRNLSENAARLFAHLQPDSKTKPAVAAAATSAKPQHELGNTPTQTAVAAADSLPATA
jgi:hypothetical protein